MASFLAFLHHLAAFTLFAALVVEYVLLRDELSLRLARKIQIADIIFGIAAGIVLLVGFGRVFHFEKGAHYYFHNWAFIAKISLFLFLGVASIVPTLEFPSWRKAGRQGQVPTVSARKMQVIRSIIHLEMVGVLGILLCAALMAKGIGIMP